LDFRQLRYFVTIVDSGTLTEASRRLHVVQPALSQRLAALEADMGVQLLVRGRSGLAVTEAGQELYERARLILKQTDMARAAVQEKAGQATGRVGIGLLRSLAPAMGVQLFNTIRSELPGVRPDIVVGYSEELVRMLRAAELDLSLGVQQRADAALEGRYLFTEGVHLVGHPKFFEGWPGGITAEALRGVPLLVRSTRGPIHHVLQAGAARLGFDLQIVGSVEDPASVVELCSSGEMATYVPESTARHLAHAYPALMTAPILEPALDRQVYSYTHADIPKTGAVIAVEDIIARLVRAYRQEAGSPGMEQA
jgi:LysR family nitrogen assimilation transcriptional regulator